MVTAAENEGLTRVGRGTPMGELMREFWIPACLSTEIAVDGDPMRFMLLGEKLIAFRDSTGGAAIFDHRACFLSALERLVRSRFVEVVAADRGVGEDGRLWCQRAARARGSGGLSIRPLMIPPHGRRSAAVRNTSAKKRSVGRPLFSTKSRRAAFTIAGTPQA